jgi:putative hydrolase of the HAD superfamily
VLRAVAFDLDDTLAITASDRAEILRRAAERADVPLTFDRQDYRDAHREHSGGASRRPVFDALVDGDAAAITDAYREAIAESLEAVPGAAEAVADLRGRYRVGLLTDGPDETQRDKLRRLGWTDAFDAVVVTGAVDAPKPDPDAFAALCEALGTEPRETAYVGDDPDRDVAGAAAAGLLPIQVLYDGSPDIHPAAAGTIRRDDLAELGAVLEEAVGDGADDA